MAQLLVDLINTRRKRYGMSGAESQFDLSPLESSNTGLIPEAAKRALHNLPKFNNGEKIIIDLVEYPELAHVGVRCYQEQLDGVSVEVRLRVFERMAMMVKVLATWNVSASMEKVPGKPPTYVR
jgi:hypothetical protein